jgi:hypothetical protein
MNKKLKENKYKIVGFKKCCYVCKHIFSRVHYYECVIADNVAINEDGICKKFEYHDNWR